MPHGSGAINQALKANRALVAKRKKQKFSYATATDETNRFTKEATPEQLQEIRERMHKEKKQQQRIVLLVSIVVISLLFLLLSTVNWSWLLRNFKN